VKTLMISLVGTITLAGCAILPGAVEGAGLQPPTAVGEPVLTPSEKPRGYASTQLHDDTHEITYSGPWRGSRDKIEAGLLHRAALTARQNGSTWFRFHHMPGEAGLMSHPSRPKASFGRDYGHWQPHWNYRVGSNWQRWNPEWGTAFWGETIPKKDVSRVDVHAMIELGHGPFTAAEQTDFEVAAVLRDLRPAG
jgi:hypothetical protein